jgi:hypothetical protein
MERVIRRMNSVSPEDTDSSSISGLRSENYARFFDLLGVAGGTSRIRGLRIHE